MSRRPCATLSLDLDNKWSYLKTHGDPGWESFPSYLPLVIPRILDYFRQRRQSITFFLVGQDACLQQNVESLRWISQEGHELGNHSFHHEPWLHLYSRPELEQEITRAELAIEQATEQRPRGFRGPGFSFSHQLLQILSGRGYLYDASTFPTFLGPLARAYYFFHARLSKEQRHFRRRLFGTWREGLRPLRPYRWQTLDNDLWEIPVTTMPLLRLPFHLSYVLYLACYSPRVAVAYFRSALALCRLRKIAPSLLLHPLDFLGREDDDDLGFFPAMEMSRDQKLSLTHELLDHFLDEFSVQTLAAYARDCTATHADQTAQ